MRNMNLPYRILLIQHEGYNGLLKISLINQFNKLLVQFELYDLRVQLIQSMADTFKNNPLCDDVFNSIGKVLRKTNFFGLGMAEDMMDRLNPYLSATSPLSYEIQFPDFRLFLTRQNIYRLHSFMHQYLYSYDILTSMYLIPESVNTDKSNLNSTDIQDYEISSKVDKLKVNDNEEVENTNEKKAEIIVSSGDKIIDPLLNDTFNLVPSNITKYFIIKSIIENNFEYDDAIQIDNDQLVLKLQPLIMTNSSTPKSISRDLEYITSSFSYEKEEVTEQVKQCICQINYIVGLDNITNDYLVIIQTLQFIVFIYILSIKQQFITDRYLKYGIYDIGDFINWIFNITSEHLIKSGDIQTQFKLIKFDGQTKFELGKADSERNISKIDEAIEKYKFQLEFDKEAYLEQIKRHISGDVVHEKDNSNIADTIVDNNFYIHEKRLLNIKKIIEDTTSEIFEANKKNHNLLINYYLWSNNTSDSSNRRIISEDYERVSRLLSNDYLNDDNVHLLQNINPIISANATRIENILTNIKRQKNKIEPISTLYLLHHFIVPEFDNVSLSTLLYVLYRIVIPYLYDQEGISEFIDYFHGNSPGMELC